MVIFSLIIVCENSPNQNAKARRETEAVKTPKVADLNSSAKINWLSLLAIIFWITPALGLAQTTLITFDDLHTADYATNNGVVSPQPVVALPPVAIANGYNSLNWNNLYAIDGLLVPDQLDNAAPHNSVISGYNEALSYVSVADISSATPFSLQSGFFNSLDAFNLNLEVQGFDGSTMVYDQNYTLAPTDQSVLTAYFTNQEDLSFSPQPLLLSLGLNGITDARFIVSGGEGVRFNASGGTFAMDNLTYAPAPEPSILVLTGLGGVGLLARWRQRNRRR
jgi:hypothetical protein